MITLGVVNMNIPRLRQRVRLLRTGLVVTVVDPGDESSVVRFGNGGTMLAANTTFEPLNVPNNGR